MPWTRISGRRLLAGKRGQQLVELSARSGGLRRGWPPRAALVAHRRPPFTTLVTLPVNRLADPSSRRRAAHPSVFTAWNPEPRSAPEPLQCRGGSARLGLRRLQQLLPLAHARPERRELLSEPSHTALRSLRSPFGGANLSIQNGRASVPACR